MTTTTATHTPDALPTDKALFELIKTDFPGARVTLDRDWNEYRLNVPGAAVESFDKCHDKADQMAARADVYHAAARHAARAPDTPNGRTAALAAELDSLTLATICHKGASA